MGIVNRRNAMLGWAVWQVGKRVAEQKAKSSISTEGGKTKRRLSKAAFIAGVAAVAGALVFWRKKSSDDELPPV
jgi:hypothetical protein